MENNFEIIAQKELSQAEIILQKAEAQQIKTQEDAEAGNDLLKDIKNKSKEIEGLRTSFVKPLNDTVGLINSWFKKPLAVLADAEKKLKSGIMAYDNEVRRQIEEQQAKLQAEAAERERKEREKLEARADKAEASGKTGKADELRQQAEEVTIQAPVLAAPKSTISYRTDYDFEVVDKALIPEKYKLIDETTIRKVVRAEKEACEIPGIKIVKRQVAISK